MNRNVLKIPTGGRLTSWPFTKRRRVESWTIQWQGEGFELGISGLQIQRPKQLGHSVSTHTLRTTAAELKVVIHFRTEAGLTGF